MDFDGESQETKKELLIETARMAGLNDAELEYVTSIVEEAATFGEPKEFNQFVTATMRAIASTLSDGEEIPLCSIAVFFPGIPYPLLDSIKIEDGQNEYTREQIDDKIRNFIVDWSASLTFFAIENGNNTYPHIVALTRKYSDTDGGEIIDETCDYMIEFHEMRNMNDYVVPVHLGYDAGGNGILVESHDVIVRSTGLDMMQMFTSAMIAVIVSKVGENSLQIGRTPIFNATVKKLVEKIKEEFYE